MRITCRFGAHNFLPRGRKQLLKPVSESSRQFLWTGRGVSHYFEPLFGVFGFVPNNQNTVLAQFLQAFRDLSEPIPCSSMFLLLSWEEYKKELVKIFSLSWDMKKKHRRKARPNAACLEACGVLSIGERETRRAPLNTPHPAPIFPVASFSYLSSNWIFSLALFCILFMKAKET